MAYPDLSTLVGASNVDALTGLDPDVQETLRLIAIAAVESFTGQKFDLEEDVTIHVDGSGKRDLPLPRRLAVLDSIEVAGSALTASDLTLSANHDTLYVTPETGYSWYERAIRDDQPPYFVGGARGVAITGDWGWTDAEIPPDDPHTRLALALRMDMEEQALAMEAGVSETSRAYVKLRVNSLSEGPLSLSIDQTAIALSPQVMMLLEPYVWRSLGVAV